MSNSCLIHSSTLADSARFLHAAERHIILPGSRRDDAERVATQLRSIASRRIVSHRIASLAQFCQPETQIELLPLQLLYNKETNFNVPVSLQSSNVSALCPLFIHQCLGNDEISSVNVAGRQATGRTASTWHPDISDCDHTTLFYTAISHSCPPITVVDRGGSRQGPRLQLRFESVPFRISSVSAASAASSSRPLS